MWSSAEVRGPTIGRRTGPPRLSVAERPGSTALPLGMEGAEDVADHVGALLERPEGARPEGADPPTGATAAAEQAISRPAARRLATSRAATTTKGGKNIPPGPWKLSAEK
jgi:hypothetical protein